MKQKLRSKLLLLLLITLGFIANAQNNIGINNPSPDASSVLDLTSTTQGFLAPRMLSAQRLLIPAPATGLLVYDLSLNRFMFYNGGAWNGLLTGTTGWETTGNTGTNPATNFLGTIDKNDLVFRTFSTEKMRVDTNGAVGINQPAPDIKSILHITSTTKGVLFPRLTSAQRTLLIANGSATDASRDGLLVYDTNLKNFLSWNATALVWDTIMTRSGGSGIYWQLLGNTGTNPAVNYVGTTDSTDLVFRTNGRERLRIKANGLFFTNNQGAGAQNIFFGDSAGFSVTIGYNNAGLGLAALRLTTTGYNNSALGSYALENNTTGYNNTGVGIESLRNNTTGYGNTSVGERSGYGNTTAYGNTSVGRYAIYNNTIGLENVGVGDSVLYGSSADVGDFNVAVGNRVLFNNTGLRNVGMGYRALRANTTGSDNVGIGTDAMLVNTTGNENVGIGTNALYENVLGVSNVGIGTYAGYGIKGDYNVAVGRSTISNAGNTVADFNVAMGYYALFTDTIPINNVTIGSYSMYYGNQRTNNVAIGYDALRGSAVAGASISIQNNVAIGTNAGRLITTGDNNVFLGTSAGQNISTGTDNVFAGTNAGFANTSASNNVFAGMNSGLSNTTSDDNVFIGTNAGRINTTSLGNHVFIGSDAGRNNTTGYFNSFVGFQAGRSNTSGNSNSFYGWSSGYLNTSGFFNTFVGALSGYSNTTGDENSSFGEGAGITNTTGNRNTFIGAYSDATAVNGVNRTTLGNLALVNANNKIRLGDPAVTVIEGQPLNYTGLSDGRFKRDLKDDVVGLDFIMKLKPISYNFDKVAYNNFIRKNNKDSLHDLTEELTLQSKIRQSGFVAQDMEKARIESGYNSFDAVAKPEDENGTWGIAYGTLVVPLVKSVQELNNKNTELEKQNADLKAMFEQYKSSTSKEIEELRKLIESLKKK
jgi:trimeric autotransporter adhesin